MGMYFAAGDGLNLWGRGTEINTYASEDTRLTASPAADAAFPVANVHDGFPSQMMRYGNITAPHTLTLYMQQLKNGELDTWSLASTPDEWTSSAGVAETVVVGEVINGSAVKMTSDGTVRTCTQSVSVRPGEWLRLQGAMRGDGAGGGDAAVLKLILLEYGGYALNSSSLLFDAIATDTFTENNAAHVTKTVDFQVPSYEDCGFRQWVTLQVSFRTIASAGRIAYYDQWHLVPQVNALTVHGHNHRQFAGPKLRGDSNFFAGAGTEISAFTTPEARPTQWVRNATMQTYTSYRWEKTGGQPSELGNPWIGESVLCQLTELTRMPAPGGIRIGHTTPQMRSPDLLGDQRVYQTGSGHPQRTLKLDFRYFTDAAFEQVYNDLVRRSHFGVYPCLIVFDSDDPGSAIYGRPAPAFQVQYRQMFSLRRASVTIQELPFPTVIA